MRFDPERVIHHAGGAESDEPILADSLFKEITGSGWRLEREPVRNTSLPLVYIIILLFFWIKFEVQRIEPEASGVLRIGVSLWFLSALGFGFWFMLKALPHPIPSALNEHVLASDDLSRVRPARLVVFTRVAGTGTDGSSWGLMRLVVTIMLPGIALLIPWFVSLARQHPRAGWGVLVAQCFGVFYASRQLAGSRNAPDVAGLAMLAELARTWPRSVKDRVETWLVATTDVRGLARVLDQRFAEEIPTMAVAIDTSAPGSDLWVFGRGEAADSVAAAASALWIPHQRSRRVPIGVGHQGFKRSAIPCVTIRCPKGDPAALARVAQLLAELALRWGKQRT